MTLNPVIIVQARMASTRLPGKVLKPVLDKPLLLYLLERLQRVKAVSQVIVATSDGDIDDPISDMCGKADITVFRGSESDVLSRYYHAAVQAKADPVIRITADCPLIDPAVIDRVLHFYLNHTSQYTYVSNTLERTYPMGMDTEVFSFQSLTAAYREALDPPEREHVTPFLYRNPQRFPLAQVTQENNQAQLRWTVDTPDDFKLIRTLLESLYPAQPEFTLQDLTALWVQHPQWAEINAQVVQKTLID